MPTSQADSSPSDKEEEDGHSGVRLRVSHATDILLDPVRSTAPRYTAYRHARARFWEAFPGGRYTRLPTPGTNLECGFHALRLSMRHQLPSLAPPTLGELRDVFRGEVVAGRNEGAAMDNGTYFTADQLSAVFSEWGRRRPGLGLRCQLGYVSDGAGDDDYDGVPVMMNTPQVDTAEEGGLEQGIARVWVYNDGWSLRGGVGHFEGIRRPTPQEVQRENPGGGGDETV
ncbi:hypothetical protein MFIFM68171_06931 [Madurella fahalii]|uniref:Uncharacterized protein n=1 Tax=Madurella fahalii TaxID=1157608 RepID=A0ABQ0GG34_9PEZI